MKTLHLLAASVALSFSAGVFAQATTTTTTAGTSTDTSSASTTPKKRIHLPKLGAHKTKGTDTTGTPDAPAGNTTGMSGSGPGVPANQNGMGTTPTK